MVEDIAPIACRPSRTRAQSRTATIWRTVCAVAVWWLAVGVPSALAQISVTITQPIQGRYQIDPLTISASITSEFEIASVQATVLDRSIVLTSASGADVWAGTLSLPGVPAGTYQLTVTATDWTGESVQVNRQFLFDRLPVLTVAAPAMYALGQPDLRVTAQCTDDGPTCRVMVTEGGHILAEAAGSIDVIVRPSDGARDLTITAIDSTLRETAVVRRVFVQSSPKLRSVASFTGTIFDIDADRALVFDDVASPAVLRLVERSTGAAQSVWTTPDDVPIVGFLSPGGALFGTRRNNITTLREWKDGALLDLEVFGLTSLVVKGAWALWSAYPTPCCFEIPLMLRDLANGTNTIVSTTAGNIENDLTPDGHVFFWAGPRGSIPYEIFAFDPTPPTATTQLTAAAPLWSVYPKSDGSNVVFARTAGVNSPTSIVMRTGAGQEVVLVNGLISPDQSFSYQVSAGWVAFTRPGTGASVQVWVRAPDGTMRQMSNTGEQARVEALNANGEVIFALSDTRYLTRPGGTAVALGAPLGVPVWLDDAWHVVLGPHLLALVPAQWTLAEGAVDTFFTTDVAILNPNPSQVAVRIKYLPEDGPGVEETRLLPAHSRTTIHENEVTGLERTSFSTVVDVIDNSPLVVERLMTWDARGYGGHLGTAVDRPRHRWLFAAGGQGTVDTFFLLANTGARAARVRFTFVLERGSPVTHTVTVPAGSRKTLWTGAVPGLSNRSFATALESNQPIVAERAMYFGVSPFWAGGQVSAAVARPSNVWFHAESPAGPLDHTDILLFNPGPATVRVDVTCITTTNQRFSRRRVLPPMSRRTIALDQLFPELADVAASTLVTADGPIVSERSVYWRLGTSEWREGYTTVGLTSSGIKWGLAEGRDGGPRGYQTHVLVSNRANGVASLRATFVREDGVTVERTYSVGAQEQLTIDTSAVAELANRNFGTIIESTNLVPINVQSVINWNANGVNGQGGDATLATRLQ